MRPQNSTLHSVAAAFAAVSSSSTSSTSKPTSRSSSSASMSSNSTHSGGVGALILQGLGSSSASTAADWEACQASQVAWSEGSSSFFGAYLTTAATTQTFVSSLLTLQEPLGVASPYTTINGIPRVHGELKATATSQYVGTYAETSAYTYTETEHSVTSFVTYPSPQPSCTIPRPVCKSLWQSYLASLGAPTTIDSYTVEPLISPVPTNRPRCSYADIVYNCVSAPKPSCYISASKVDLFYWPQITPAPSVQGVVTAVHNNVTFTSPNIYLQFDYLQAYQSLDLDQTCNVTRPLGAGMQTLVGGGVDAPITTLPALTSALVTLHPTELSSFVRDLGPGVDTLSVVNEIARGGPSYSYWVNAVLGTQVNFPPAKAPYVAYRTAILTQQVDFANFDSPDPAAYYLNPNGAFGCSRLGPHSECGTIFDGAYRAQLSVPHEVIALKPEWSTCSDYLLGAYDPPIALQGVADIAQPSGPGGGGAGATTSPAQGGPTSGPAQPGVTAPPTAGPTTPPTSPPANSPSPSQPQQDQNPPAPQPNPPAPQPNPPAPQPNPPAPQPNPPAPQPNPPAPAGNSPAAAGSSPSPAVNSPAPALSQPAPLANPTGATGSASQSQEDPGVSGAAVGDPGTTGTATSPGTTASDTATMNGGQVPAFFPQPTSSTSSQDPGSVTSSGPSIRAATHILATCIIAFAFLAI